MAGQVHKNLPYTHHEVSNTLLHTSLAQLQQSADDTISLPNGAPMTIPLTTERTLLTNLATVTTPYTCLNTPKPRNPATMF